MANSRAHLTTPVNGSAALFCCVLFLLVGCSSSETLIKPTKLGELESSLPVSRVWKKVYVKEAERNVASLPIFVDDAYYYWIDSSGILYALDATNGKQVWTVDTGNAASSAVAGREDLLLLGTRDAEVVAIDKESGQIRWRGEVSSEVLSPPQLAKGIVVVHCADGRLFGLDAVDGRELWRFESKVPLLTLRGTSTPVIVDEFVIVGLANGKLVALKLWDGKPRWEVEIAAPRGRSELERMVDVDAVPVVVDNVIYTVSYRGRAAAVRLTTGRVIWSRELSSSVGMAADEDKLYITDDAGALWALNRGNGSVMWKQEDLVAREITAPTIYRDQLLVGDLEGYLHWLDKETGHIVHRSRSDATPIDVAPVVANDKVYLTSRGGILDTLELKN